MTATKFSIAHVASAAACAILLSTVCIAGTIAPAQAQQTLAHQIAAPHKG